MRLRIGIPWLFAASLATAQPPQRNDPGGNGNENSSTEQPVKSLVTWNQPTDFQTFDQNQNKWVEVLAVNSSRQYTFTFTADNSIKVQGMKLFRNQRWPVNGVPLPVRGEQLGTATPSPTDPAGNSGSPHSTASPSAPGGINHLFDDDVPRSKPTTMPPFPRKEAPEDLAVRQNAVQTFSLVMNGAVGTATVDFNVAFHDNVHGKPLFFQVEWDAANGQTGGKSYSRWFAVAAPNTAEYQNPDRLFSQFQWTGKGSISAAFPDEQPTGGGALGGPSMTPGAAPTPTGGSNVDPAINGGGTNAGAASQPESGLSKNAIIGIAVGCGVAGLLLVGALAWFLIRRGRKQRAASTPYGSDRHRRTAELIAEKEATAGVNDSPHSPYSDDGLHGHHGHADAPPPHRRGLSSTAAAGGDGAAGVLLHSSLPDERSYTPYTDQAMPVSSRSVPAAAAMPPNSSRSPSRAAGGARSATPEGRYAHLMSPDMTPEERARIEEEERALDRAIEEAGRASRP